MFVSIGVKVPVDGDCAVTSPSSPDTAVATLVIVPTRKPAVVIAVLAALSFPSSYGRYYFFSDS